MPATKETAKDLGSKRFSDRQKSSRLAVNAVAFIGWKGSTEKRMHELSKLIRS